MTMMQFDSYMRNPPNFFFNLEKAIISVGMLSGFVMKAIILISFIL